MVLCVSDIRQSSESCGLGRLRTLEFNVIRRVVARSEREELLLIVSFNVLSALSVSARLLKRGNGGRYRYAVGNYHDNYVHVHVELCEVIVVKLTVLSYQLIFTDSACDYSTAAVRVHAIVQCHVQGVRAESGQL